VGLVAQRIALDVAEHVGDPVGGQRLQRRLFRLTGEVGVPDLESSGNVAAVTAQHADDVLLGDAGLLCEAGEQRESIRPSGSSPRKKFCRRSLRARTCTAVSGIADDRMVLSTPNVATAPGSVTKSKVRHGPVSTPTRVPYSSTTRSAIVAPGRDRRGQFHTGLAHGGEEAVHHDGRLAGLELPDVLLRGAQPAGELTLAQPGE
jgi:hypothetical protein